MILLNIEIKVLVFLAVAVLFLFLFALNRRSKRKQHFRKIGGIAQLKKSIGQSVEEGNRLHVSLGGAGLPGETAASGMAGLAALTVLPNSAAWGIYRLFQPAEMVHWHCSGKKHSGGHSQTAVQPIFLMLTIPGWLEPPRFPTPWAPYQSCGLTR